MTKASKDKTDQVTVAKIAELQDKQLNESSKQSNSRVKKYRPNKRQRLVRRTVYDRYYELRDNDFRKRAEQDWEIADKEYRMYFSENEDDTTDLEERKMSNLYLPDSFAAIQAHSQESVDRRSRPYLSKVEPTDEPIEHFVNSILRYNMDVTNFDLQYYLAKLNGAIRGTSFLKEYWRKEVRNIKEPSDIDEEGNIKYVNKEIVDMDDSYTEWKENEYVYFDEKARHIDFAVDCVEREILNIDEFKRIYSSRAGFFDVECVTAGGDTTTNSVFKLPKDITEQDVEILHYYNRATDAYWVVANNVTISDGPIPFPHKELPYGVYYHYQIPGYFYGLGIPKIIHYLSEERRSIRNLNMDRQHLQIHKMFIHNNSYDLDEEDLVSRPHGLISVDTQGGSIRDAIMPLEYGDVPSSYFRTEEILLEDIRRAHGIDDRIQGVNMGGTATEAAILKESALKRVNLVSTLAELDVIRRIGKLKWSNIQFFYPIARKERITEDNQTRERKVVKKIPVDGKKFSIVNKNGKTALKMDEVEGKSVISLTKDMSRFLKDSFDVTIDSTVNAPVSKAIQQTKVIETVSLINAQPNLAGQLDPTKTTSRLFEVIDENPKNWMADRTANSVGDMMMLADKENMIMKAGQPLDATDGATQEHTLVHMMYMQTSEFEQLPDEIQTIFLDHVGAEHENNPETGSFADEMQANGLMGGPGEGEMSPDDMPPAGMGPAINPMGIPADQAEAPQIQAADMQGANFQG